MAFDEGLNAAIRKLRIALGDSTENPRFIETIPRRGYRLIAPVDEAIGEARIAVQEENSGSPVSESAMKKTGARGHPRRVLWLWMAAGIAIIFALTAGIGWWRAARPKLRPLMRFSAGLVTRTGNTASIGQTVVTGGAPGAFLALSPDGMRLAIKIRDADDKVRLGIRRLDERQFKSLPGTERANSPFFSPDGRWLAFFADGKLKKISVEGGAPQPLCNSNDYASGSWGDDGNIIAALDLGGGLSRIPSGGGAPSSITELKEGEIAHRWPQVLPGSRAAIFTVYTESDPDDATVEVLSFKTHERKMLVRGGAMGRFVAASDGAGFLVYLHQHTLFAAPFDLGMLAVTGTPQPILDDVSSWYAPSISPGDFDISRTGTLAYLSGEGEDQKTIFWLDRTGKIEPLHPEPGHYYGLRFSPDGKRLAFASGEIFGHDDLWIQDLDRNTVERLTSFPGSSTSPLWSRDGAHILFSVNGQPNAGIYWIRSDGTGQPQKLGKGSFEFPSSFSPDGKRLALSSSAVFSDYRQQVLVAPFKGTADNPTLGNPQSFVKTEASMPSFSPDGHWIAYSSGETGTSEIYVQAFPGPGEKVAISVGGGAKPLWSPNGRELFYVGSDFRIRVVSYTATANSFSSGKPRIWCQRQIFSGGAPLQYYALAPDGKRLAVLLDPHGSASQQRELSLTFLLNFSDELSRRISGR